MSASGPGRYVRHKHAGTTLDGCDEVVLHSGESDGIVEQVLCGGAVSIQDLQIGRDAIEQPVEPLLINHPTPYRPTRSDAGGSAPGWPGSRPGSAAGSLPATAPGPGIVIEEQAALLGDSPGQPQRCAIEHDQIHPMGDVHLPGSGSSVTPPGADIQVAVRACRTASRWHRTRTVRLSPATPTRSVARHPRWPWPQP
jgi:hypothetical protein